MSTTTDFSVSPAKFSIHDSDLSSDGSEIDCDEWVSVSSSHIISTTSTLPSHLNMKPRSSGKTASNVPKHGTSRPFRHSAPSSPPPSPSETSSPASTCVSQPVKYPHLPSSSSSSATSTSSSNSSTSTVVPNPPSRPSAISNLKQHISNLSAIYLVSPISISPNYYNNQPQPSPDAQSTTPPKAQLPRLSMMHPHPPISITPSSNTTTTTVATVQGTCLRICSDCAKPRITIYCNGTWNSSASGLCNRHVLMISNLKFSAGRDCGGSSKGACKYAGDHGGCRRCGVDKEIELFGDVLEAVALFRRVETERCGVKVFDMSVPVSGEVYRHVEGCGCLE